MNPIQSYKGLVAWQEGHKLVLMVDRNTENFPKSELFGLVSQMRRCAVSVTSNIAEGFSRRSKKEKIHFYTFSLGSLMELKNQTLISKDLTFITDGEFNHLQTQIDLCRRLIYGIIDSAESAPE